MTHGPHYCDWCNEEIEEPERAKFVVDGEPGRDSRVVAAFHDGTLPCYAEARDYGWRE